jgi:hypothetical protein
MSSARLRPAAALVAGAALVTGAAACTTDAPTAPAAGRGPATTLAGDYLARALAFERAVSYHTRQVDWPALTRAVTARADGARTTGDTHAAIAYSISGFLRPLGDRHSAFWPASDAPGLSDSPPTAAYRVAGQTLRTPGGAPRPVGYVWMPTYAGRNDVGRADSTQAVLRTLDADQPCGWVIDLRNNPGGAWAAMLAGLNPLVGDAPAGPRAPGFGGFVDADSARAHFWVQDGAAGVYDPADDSRAAYVRATTNYTLRRPASPVAILQGGATASAGEMIVLAFRGGPAPVRTFGQPTYGVTTVPYGTYLQPDSAFLNITAAVMFDRTGRTYGGALAPDVSVATATGPNVQIGAADAAVTAALQWLAGRPECGGTGSASGGPLADRRPAGAPSALPGHVRARPDAPPVSRWFLPGGTR